VKVGVNLLWLRTGVVGGSEAYLCRQLEGLAELAPPDLELTVFALPAFAPAHREITVPIRVAPLGPGRRAARVVAESTWLARATRNLDLVHHGGGTVPALTTAPAVLTVHDLQYLSIPATFSAAKLAYLRVVVPRSVRRASVVCVPSEFVAATVVDGLGAARDKVVVVPHGLPASALGRPATGEAELRRRLALPGPTVVYPAITYRHKNHAVLVEALARLAPSWPDLRLVLLGAPGPAEQDLVALVARRGLGGAVVRPGRVSDADRDGLYALATAMAFPSRYEGFGAPALEAMARGCPVLAADATALPEVVGDGGRLLDPDDPDAWAGALAALASDAAERARWAAAGRTRAARFTATRSAAALLGAYRAALSP